MKKLSTTEVNKNNWNEGFSFIGHHSNDLVDIFKWEAHPAGFWIDYEDEDDEEPDYYDKANNKIESEVFEKIVLARLKTFDLDLKDCYLTLKFMAGIHYYTVIKIKKLKYKFSIGAQVPNQIVAVDSQDPGYNGHRTSIKEYNDTNDDGYWQILDYELASRNDYDITKTGPWHPVESFIYYMMLTPELDREEKIKLTTFMWNGDNERVVDHAIKKYPHLLIPIT